MTRSTSPLNWIRKGVVLALCGLSGFAAAEPDRRAAEARALPSIPARTPAASDMGNAATIRQLIVKFRDHAALQDPSAGADASRDAQQRWSAMSVAAQRYGIQRLSYVRSLSTHANVLRLDRPLTVMQAEALARDIAATDPAVLYAQPDHIGQTQAKPLPNDEYLDLQELGATALVHFTPPGAPNDPGSDFTFFQPNVIKAWERSAGAGIVVAVVDTGVLPHPDLIGNLVPGYDFITGLFTGDTDQRDDNAEDPGTAITQRLECLYSVPLRDSDWHGTGVAGIIAATPNNSVGIAGIAYDAQVLPVRVVDKCGYAESDLVDAMIWASGGAVSGVKPNPTPARVLNLSLSLNDETLGPLACGQAMQDAVDLVRANNSVVVVPAGNKHPFLNIHPLRSPASCNGVIVVSAINSAQGVLSSYSKTGTGVTLSAVGEQLTTGNFGTTVPAEHGYLYRNGTSFAAPVVAGVAALMLSKNPRLTPDEVKTLLQRTAQPFVTPCNDQCPGAGVVDAAAAVEASLSATPRPVLLRFGEKGDFKGGLAYDISLCAGFDRASKGLRFDLYCSRLAANRDTHLRYVETTQTILNVDSQCLTRVDQTRVSMTFQACAASNPNQRFDFHLRFARRAEWKAMVPAAGTVTGDAIAGLGEACAWLDTLRPCRFQTGSAIAPETQITLMDLPP